MSNISKLRTGSLEEEYIKIVAFLKQYITICVNMNLEENGNEPV